MSNEKSTPAKIISPSYTSPNGMHPNTITTNHKFPNAISPNDIPHEAISPNNCVQIGQVCIIDPCHNYQTPLKPGYSTVSVSPQQNSNAPKSVASMLSKTIRETESKIHHQKELYEIQKLTNKQNKLNSEISLRKSD